MEERSPKRVKNEPPEGLPVPVKSEEGDDDDNNVTVEFKFRNCKTAMFNEGVMTGTLQVPMLQNPQTGRFRVPPGTTQAKGRAFFEYVSFGGLSQWNFENDFTATFERPDISSPIESFKLGYRLFGEADDSGFHTGLVNSNDQVVDSNDPTIYGEFQTYKTEDTNRDLYRARLNNWEENAGGMLTIFADATIDDTFLENLEEDMQELYDDTVWQADHKIKLYTVLSAHSPDVSSNNLKIESDAVPQWDKLEQLMVARFPDKDISWAKRAVKNYVYFLDMKKEHNDWNSELFSPSKNIDEVWHAHLSFTGRYQYDMMAYCGHIIEHSPALGAKALRQYYNAFDKHVDQMKNMEERVDHEFWPKPIGQESYFKDKQCHDGDSDDCCFLPDHSNCG